VATAQQFICKKCAALSQIQTFEEHHDGAHFARCQHCEAKNQLVVTGATPSQPGLLQVIQLLD
jgi:hypothetical protein